MSVQHTRKLKEEISVRLKSYLNSKYTIFNNSEMSTDQIKPEISKPVSKSKTEDKSPRKVRNVVKAIFVRSLLIIHSLLTVWRTADVLDNDLFWFLAIPNILVVVEGLYCIIVLKGNERKWFCPCFFLYLICTVPSLWLLEMDRLDLFGKLVSSTNLTAVSDSLSTIQGVTLPITMDPDTWIEVLEQSMLFLLIVGRWMLPRGSLTRDQLSQLLFVYIGAASDVMELFVVFEENEVRNDRGLSLATLIVWTFSLLQFTLVLTATKSPKELQAVNDSEEEYMPQKERCGFCTCQKFFELELWSLVISICLMDAPYLGIRLYALIVYQLITYGILFFLCKNILMLTLLLYRIVIVCSNVNCSYKEDETNQSSERLATNETTVITMNNLEIGKSPQVYRKLEKHHESQDSGFTSNDVKQTEKQTWSAGRTRKVSPANFSEDNGEDW